MLGISEQTYYQPEVKKAVRQYEGKVTIPNSSEHPNILDMRNPSQKVRKTSLPISVLNR